MDVMNVLVNEMMSTLDVNKEAKNPLQLPV